MTGGHESPIVDPAHHGQIVIGHRAQTRRAFGEFVLPQTGQHRARVIEQIPHARYGRRGVVTMLVLRGAHDDTVVPGHQVDMASVYPRPDHVRGRGHRAGSPSQPQYLSLHRTNRQIRKCCRLHPVRDHDLIGGCVFGVGNRRALTHTERLAFGGQHVQHRAIVDGEFFGRGESATDVLRQQRLDVAGIGGRGNGMPAAGQPVRHGPQLTDVGRVDGHGK